MVLHYSPCNYNHTACNYKLLKNSITVSCFLAKDMSFLLKEKGKFTPHSSNSRQNTSISALVSQTSIASGRGTSDPRENSNSTFINKWVKSKAILCMKEVTDSISQVIHYTIHP